MPSSRSLLEPRGVDRSLQQLVEYAPTTIEVSECEDEYQSREDVLLPNIEEDSEYSKRPPSIKTLPPSLLLSGGFPQRPQSDMLSWEPLETQPKTEPDEDEDEDVFEAVAPNVQLVQQTPVEIMALQSILLQRKLGDGYFGDVWTGKLFDVKLEGESYNYKTLIGKWVNILKNILFHSEGRGGSKITQ